jgi:hypothetical protein
MGVITWVQSCGCNYMGAIAWVQLCGCNCVGAIAWVQSHGCSCVGAVAWVQSHGCNCVGCSCMWVQLRGCSCVGAIPCGCNNKATGQQLPTGRPGRHHGQLTLREATLHTEEAICLCLFDLLGIARLQKLLTWPRSYCLIVNSD